LLPSTASPFLTLPVIRHIAWPSLVFKFRTEGSWIAHHSRFRPANNNARRTLSHIPRSLYLSFSAFLSDTTLLSAFLFPPSRWPKHKRCLCMDLVPTVAPLDTMLFYPSSLNTEVPFDYIAARDCRRRTHSLLYLLPLLTIIRSALVNHRISPTYKYTSPASLKGRQPWPDSPPVYLVCDSLLFSV